MIFRLPILILLRFQYRGKKILTFYTLRQPNTKGSQNEADVNFPASFLW